MLFILTCATPLSEPQHRPDKNISYIDFGGLSSEPQYGILQATQNCSRGMVKALPSRLNETLESREWYLNFLVKFWVRLRCWMHLSVMKGASSVFWTYCLNSSFIPAHIMNSSHNHKHDTVSASRIELSLGSTKDRRIKLLLDDASEDLLLEELLPKR